jgi:hypothetical protein
VVDHYSPHTAGIEVHPTGVQFLVRVAVRAMVDIELSAVTALVGVVSGGLLVWLLIGDYYKISPTEREKELWKQVAELQALLRVPPLFWHIWERYLERSHQTTGSDAGTRGKHAAPQAPEETDDSTPPRGERG